MAEAMIIHQQLDASPNKMRHAQQLFPQQLYHNGLATAHHQHQQQQQQISTMVQTESNKNLDGYFPGYMYNCYPCVIPPSRPSSCQEPSGRNTATTLLSGSQQQQQQQQQQVLTEAMPYSQQQAVMLHNGLVPNGYISSLTGFYSLVPVNSAVLTNEMLSCQPTLVPLDSGYQHHHHQQQQHHHHQHQHPYQSPPDGQGVHALLGPVIGYHLPYLAQHFQHLQHHHRLHPQFPGGGNGTADIHRKVIIMKDASLQTEFNEKISNSLLVDLPNSFFVGAKDGFKCSSPVAGAAEPTHPLSKGTDTHSLMKGCNFPTPKVPSPHPFTSRPQGPPHNFYRPGSHQPNNFNHCPLNYQLQSNFQNVAFPASAMAFQHGQSLCFSPASYNGPMLIPPLPLPPPPSLPPAPGVFHFPVNQNNSHLQPANLNVTLDKNGVDRRPKLYRKTRTDQGQRTMTNPTFEVKKEFSDILDAVGSLVAQNGSVGKSEPSGTGAASKGSDFVQGHSEEKMTAQAFKGNKNARRNFSTKSANGLEINGKFASQTTSPYGKMPNFLPLADFSRLQFNVYNGRSPVGGDLFGWPPNFYQKNHDIRSVKRKQQKRQMLANKAAEEELEEISKERDNLLRGMLTSKQTTCDPPGGSARSPGEDEEGVPGEAGTEDPSHHFQDANEETSKFGDFDEDGNPAATLEFIELESGDAADAGQRSDLESTKKTLRGGDNNKENCGSSSNNNSLEENPSPLSQMSPLAFSPPLSCPNELMNGDDPTTGCIMSKIHSRRFREYCSQVLDKEIDDRCVQLLQDLVKFQDQMYHVDPSKAKSKKRFVLGLREVAKHLKMGKLKCVIISPNLEQTQNKGGLDEALKSIIETCQAQEVPFVFALGRRALGRACAKLVPVSVVGIFNYEGVEENFAVLKNLTEKARDAYSDMVSSLKREAALQANYEGREDLEAPGELKEKCLQSLSSKSIDPVQNSSSAVPLGPPPGGFEKLFPHLGHSRTPSACSAISFISSVLSEPISENMPHSEPEVESKVPDGDFAPNAEPESDSKPPEGDSTREKCLAPVSSADCCLINGSTEATADSAAWVHNGPGRANNPEAPERPPSEMHRVLPLESKSILTSIHENCELEIPNNAEGQRKDADDRGLQSESDLGALRPASVSDEAIDGREKSSKKKRTIDRVKRIGCFGDGGDSNDGNDADTEEDRGCKSAEGVVRCPRSPRGEAMVRDGIHPSVASVAGAVVKSRRRRSKEEKSDDDKTIIVSKEEEDAAVFSLDGCSVDKTRRPNELHPGKVVEVILARFSATPSGRHAGLPEEEEEEEEGESAAVAASGRNREAEKEPSLPRELSLSSSSSSSSCTTSRIETWVAESQKALRGLSLLSEEEEEEEEEQEQEEEQEGGDDEFDEAVVGGDRKAP